MDPMAYPLMYLHHGSRWMPNMKSTNNKINIPALQSYSQRLSVRNGFTPFFI